MQRFRRQLIRWRLWVGICLSTILLWPLTLSAQPQVPAVALPPNLGASSGQTLPAPPQPNPSLDTSGILQPQTTPGSAVQSGASLPKVAIPALQDQLPLNTPPVPVQTPLPVAVQQAPDVSTTLQTTVGREIVIERAPGATPASPPAEDGTVPVMLKERSTGNHIRVGPGNRIEVIAPKPVATPQPLVPQPLVPPQPIALLDPSQVSPQANPKGEKMMYPLTNAVPITSPFGMRTHPISGKSEFHQGTDLGAGMGAPILAAYTGQVMQSGSNGGLGNSVTLAHGPYVRTRYGHMSQVAVQTGQIIKQGTIIGYVGSTGMSTGPHLHFELWQASGGQWSPIDAYSQLQVAVAQLPR